MAQPSVACFFSTRKRSAVEENKINRARKVLLLDSGSLVSSEQNGLESDRKVISQDKINEDVLSSEYNVKLQNKEETYLLANKIVNVNSSAKIVTKKIIRARIKKTKEVSNNQDIQLLLTNMSKKEAIVTTPPQTTVDSIKHVNESDKHVTPPSTPKKAINAMDKVKEKPDGPSLKEIRRKMTRSARLAELRASMNRFQEGANKLKVLEKKTSLIPESPKLNNFKTIELEVHTSPQKVFSPEKAYLSPKKEPTARRNLIHLLSPTKNAVPALPASPSKQIFDETSKPALKLPYKYRYLAEMFRCIDTVSQILYNRKETITFRKLKPAVEEMLKRNLLEKHVSQIKHIYSDAFDFKQEKLRVFGAGMKHEQWELVVSPNIGDAEHMNSDVLLERRRKLFNILLDKVKDYHSEFLASLDPPMVLDKSKITRWHPEFDIERVPDVELAPLPQPPAEDKLTTGKEVLEKARELFNCNARMEQALQKLKEAKEVGGSVTKEEKPKDVPASVLKGIPKALLERVRQKQAAKALISMTRSADKEKEVLMYSRLPELARLTRNLFVSEKKGVLPLETVVEKLGNCYRAHLTKTDMEDHLKLIAKEAPQWLVFHDIRNCVYLKLAKNADLSVVVHKLENLAKQKSES
ncbi:DNA replication factor Cdt1 [Anoplophora glabripennis]|uniref:DNA replication factor Cdt1 n=1 Tax=Anoplophora glabripennis TaxID=217634 RepID=UPI0008744919|nr:DNA replication factor Cdt1 [Anoplophora glabripennis]